MSDTYLNYLPVELLHQILSHLTGCHILRAFHSISSYLDNVLASYNHYLLDLSSEDVSKNDVTRLRAILRPEQIVGLKLGRNYSSVFHRWLLVFFDENALTRLRSLWIHKTIRFDDVTLHRIRSLVNFDQLVALRIDQLTVNRTDFSFAALSRLVTSSSTQFRLLSSTIPAHLTHLHMFFDSIDELEVYLQYNHRHMRSLGIDLRCEWIEVSRLVDLLESFSWTELIEFNLNIVLKSKSNKV